MEDEEDEVFRPVSRCWGAPFREIKCEDRATQTSSLALRLRDGMLPGLLPCAVIEETPRLFYGNTGFRLHFPAFFERVRERNRTRELNRSREQQREQCQEQRALRSEVQIGRNLQLIGDELHQERLQLYHRTQRNQQPAWWRAAMTVCSLLFDRGGLADHGRGVLR